MFWFLRIGLKILVLVILIGMIVGIFQGGCRFIRDLYWWMTP